MASGDKNDSDVKKAAKPAAPKNPQLAQMQARATAMAANRSKPVSMGQFFQEAWVELKKTSWPTREVLIKSTSVVLAFVLAVAVWVGTLDFFLSKVLAFITGR